MPEDIGRFQAQRERLDLCGVTSYLSAMSDTDISKSETASAGGVDPKLLEILVCPVTREPLTYDREAGELISKAAGLAYPIREGVPIMLPEEARELES